MGKRDVINTYIANLNKYKHLLSIDYIRKKYNFGDEKIFLKSKQR